MTAKKKPVWRSFYRRLFLNRPHFHTTAIVLAKVSTSRDERYVSANATLTDCSDRINLDFSFSNERGRGNAIAKAMRLEKVFLEMAEALAEAPLPTREELKSRRSRSFQSLLADDD